MAYSVVHKGAKKGGTENTFIYSRLCALKYSTHHQLMANSLIRNEQHLHRAMTHVTHGHKQTQMRIYMRTHAHTAGNT